MSPKLDNRKGSQFR